MGRDRVLRDLLKIAEKREDLVVAVIDYEKGPARVYIEEQFEMSSMEGGVSLGTSSQKRNLLAIVFDPNIEEGLLCRVNEALCRDPYYYRRVKSKRACEVVERNLKEDYAKGILNKLVAELLKRVKGQKAGSQRTTGE